MPKTKAARDCCSNHTPVIVHRYDKRTFPIIPDYDRTASIGAVILGVAFGVMFVIGAWFGWI